MLAEAQKQPDAVGTLDWVVSIDSAITWVHQHGATLPRAIGARSNHGNPRTTEPEDHAIGRSRGGLTCKIHLVCGGAGRLMGWVLTGGDVNDTTMMVAVLDQIRVPRAGAGRPRTCPERVLAGKGYPCRANRAWLRD